MFQKHKAEKAAKQQQSALASWQQLRDGYAHLLEVAQGFDGASTDEIMLKGGEALFYKVTSCALVEERRGPGHYQGGSTGVSIPIGSLGGRSVRYRVGANRGHFVQGAPVPTAIDTGTVFITNQRVVFAGNKQTRECLFAKTIGIAHDDAAGETTISVSNRQKPTVIHYGSALSGDFDFRLQLALSHFKGTVPDLVTQMRQHLAEIDAQRPGAPPGAPTAPPGVPVAAPPPAPLLPPPPPPPGAAAPEVVPPADHEAGWEYLYLASELARGLAAYEGLYGRYQSQVVEPTGAHVDDPLTHIRAMNEQIIAIVNQVDTVMTPDLLEKAVGAPGQPGDEAGIRDYTGHLAAIYGQMIDWGIRIRDADVDPQWRPVYMALSKFVSLPLHQFQDFSAVFSAGAARLVADVRAGRPPEENLELALTITIDPSAQTEFHSAMDALKQGQ